MVVITRDLGYIETPVFHREKSIIFLAQSRESIHKPYTAIAQVNANFFERGRQ